jgi:hypothetical protein
VEGLTTKLPPILATLANAQSLIIAAVFGAFLGRSVRALILAFAERERGYLLLGGRLLSAVALGTLAVLYGLLTAAMMDWSVDALLVAGLAGASMLVGVAVFQLWRRRPLRLSPTATLLRVTLVLALLLLGTLTLLRSGFLALTTDRPIAHIEVTGETRPQTVRWAAPDQPMQEQKLVAHRILLRSAAPPREIIAESWLYGDQVAVKGRVLRLSPILNVVGIANLFELQFLHNGYFTAERHNQFPHQALPLQPLGPLAVHPRWRPLRDFLLARWERSTKDVSTRDLAVRAATTESTYFPLIDSQGKPVQHTFQLVLTPGGLTAR